MYAMVWWVQFSKLTDHLVIQAGSLSSTFWTGSRAAAWRWGCNFAGNWACLLQLFFPSVYRNTCKRYWTIVGRVGGIVFLVERYCVGSLPRWRDSASDIADISDSTFFDWKQRSNRLARLWALQHTLFICNENVSESLARKTEKASTTETRLRRQCSFTSCKL